MKNIIAVPFKFYSQVRFIVDYLRNKFNIKSYNKAELSLEDQEGNLYYLVNDPNKVLGYQFSGMEICPDFVVDLDLITAIRQRIRRDK